MLEMIRSLGSQLRWAAELELPEIRNDRDFVIAGMGGSGIGGDYVSAVTRSSPVGIYGHKGYAPLPGWVYRVKPLVICVSYSGNTEETLDVFADARSEGLDVIAVTTGGGLSSMASEAYRPIVDIPGGLQPRAALGYLFGSTLRIVGESAGVDFAADLNEAADVIDEITTEGSSGWNLAKGIAGDLADRIAVVYGGGPVSIAAAQRWKTQMNENAKAPAWWSALPELDHNEIVGWETMPELTSESLAIVGLADGGDHPRVADRYRVTRELTQDAVPWAGIVDSTGTSPVARIMSLTAIGDLVSWMLAKDAGVDPVPVATLEKLKDLLAKDEK